jgi:hypothetical protein
MAALDTQIDVAVDLIYDQAATCFYEGMTSLELGMASQALGRGAAFLAALGQTFRAESTKLLREQISEYYGESVG